MAIDDLKAIEELLALHLNKSDDFNYQPDGTNGNIQIGTANNNEQGKYYIRALASPALGRESSSTIAMRDTQDFVVIYVGSVQYADSQTKMLMVTNFLKDNLVNEELGILDVEYQLPTELEVTEGGMYLFSTQVSIQYNTQ